VSLDAFYFFQECVSNGTTGEDAGACLALDSITKSTIDLADYAEFQSLIANPGP